MFPQVATGPLARNLLLFVNEPTKLRSWPSEIISVADRIAWSHNTGTTLGPWGIAGMACPLGSSGKQVNRYRHLYQRYLGLIRGAIPELTTGLLLSRVNVASGIIQATGLRLRWIYVDAAPGASLVYGEMDGRLWLIWDGLDGVELGRGQGDRVPGITWGVNVLFGWT
jgi:hypothetical protein